VSRVRNADEFLLRFRGIRKAYEDHVAPLIAQIRGKARGRPPRPESGSPYPRARPVSGSDQANYWILEKNTLKRDYFWILGWHF
jgi:hypothetical protein